MEKIAAGFISIFLRRSAEKCKFLNTKSESCGNALDIMLVICLQNANIHPSKLYTHLYMYRFELNCMYVSALEIAVLSKLCQYTLLSNHSKPRGASKPALNRVRLKITHVSLLSRCKSRYEMSEKSPSSMQSSTHPFAFVGCECSTIEWHHSRWPRISQRLMRTCSKRTTGAWCGLEYVVGSTIDRKC